ncbi:MAG: ExbD/TolR family protein [Candidatus Binatia bacterium]
MRLSRRDTSKARIEIIPMIDVIFFLLVFFMVSTLSMTINRGLPVNLPRAATSQEELQESANITITQSRRLFLNKEPVALAEIGERVKGILADQPGLLVIINADDQVPHGVVVDVMDEVRLAGVSRLAIAVKPESGARS